MQNHESRKRCVLTTHSNAALFTSKILKEINTHRDRSCVVYRVQVYTGHCVKLAKAAAGGLHFRELARGLRAVSVLPCRAAPHQCQGEVHSMFAVRCHGNNPLQTKCIVCTRHATVFLVPPMPVPTSRAFSRHGRNRCRGEEMPPDRTRHDCKFRASVRSEGSPRVLCEINRPASPCTLARMPGVTKGDTGEHAIGADD